MNSDIFKNKYKNLSNLQNEEASKKPSPISKCLNHIKVDWQKNKNVASLWQDWPKVAGEKLASNCTPLTFQAGVLTIGASHPQWLQAIMFNRNQLLAALRAEGHDIKDLRIKQYYPQKKQSKEGEKKIWSLHPSRCDVHGKKICPICKISSPAGEISLWKKCGLCRRKDLSI